MQTETARAKADARRMKLVPGLWGMVQGQGRYGQSTALEAQRSPPRGFEEAKLAFQTENRPDLLPSGLYRRPRSFTGSWGTQIVGASPLQWRFMRIIPFLPAKRSRISPRGLYRRSGIGKANARRSSPCPEGLTQTPV
jgi:hypothetical protein